VRLHEDETFAEWRRDGARFAVIAGNDTKVRESATGAELALLQGHSGRVNSAKWSPDGTRIVTASDDHTVRIWDAATGSPIAILGDLHRKATICPPDCRLEDYIGPVTKADWSPDGTRILANLGNKFARVWDANRGRIVHNIYGASGTILWSPDGKQVLSFSPGGDLEDAVYVWGADAGATDLSISRLQGQVKGLNRVVWSPDGTRILTASKDGTAGVWDAKTGVRLAALKGHSKPVTSAEWSPDGTRLVTGSVDETVRVWDAHTWAEVHIQHHPGAIIRAVWSPDSSRILTTSSDNTAHVLKAWPLLTADTVLHSSVTAFRVLNGDERSSLFLDSGSPSSTAPELMTAATGEEPEILCDRLASTPFDPEKTSVSIAFLDIDFTKAVRACEAAAKAHPHDLKFQYERARVHALWYLVPADYIAFHAFQRTDMAATESVGGPTGRGSVSPSIARYRGDMILGTALSVRAIAERGYAAAIADLGQAYEFGDGVKRDPAEALRLTNKRVKRGFCRHLQPSL